MILEIFLRHYDFPDTRQQTLRGKGNPNGALKSRIGRCRRTDIESDDLKLVARALLPMEITEGSRLKYEMMQYKMEV